MYLWQHARWPYFTYHQGRVLPLVSAARLQQGQLLGELRGLGVEPRLEAELAVASHDVTTTSAIEGELLPPQSVRSSVARKLGVPRAGLPDHRDRRIDGLVDLVLDATHHSAAPMTQKRLLGWHQALFPDGRSGLQRIAVGRYRDDAAGPMQVVSRALSRKPVVHFEAPPARVLRTQVPELLEWLHGDARQLDGLVASGLAHLWFITLHPFDDGNGRLARALADLVLARADGLTERFWSMSAQLERDRADYYRLLEVTQRGGLDVTDWLVWYVGCFTRAIALASTTLARVKLKSAFWLNELPARPFSGRQLKMLKAVLEQDELTFTVKQWAHACKCSVDTAQRDIAELVERSVAARNEGGSMKTSYRFSWSPS